MGVLGDRLGGSLGERGWGGSLGNRRWGWGRWGIGWGLLGEEEGVSPGDLGGGEGGARRTCLGK